ncbi:MAG TPA: hypothetical protein DHV57_15205 [Hyphomonas sp.]|jgi:hypothetical protein|uniref:hypothetical protein n=1 Tax=uncultured Hyphomonas sp. TaxID=225298 RepID=UPI000C69939D|nr:hypothetical protein [Hyphomonadaceae bacterium]HBL93826.1 hypothetical protein [Hyphomonas sp.]HCJ18754.1 hypothetical protein [Hyphomonas sp.]|tara:strand:+ start:3538 stop:4014 length:477 start_codon:yes stop_codon:yes gene_type:complete
MTFIERFQTFVCQGDSIDTEVEGYLITARIVRDDCPDAPDERQNGFWPSLYQDAPGFIGAGNGWRARFDAAQARAEEVMRAWRADEWFYCGIVLSVSLEGVILDAHAVSLWGVEVNYPGSDNSYLTEVASELLPEALDVGRTSVARMCSALIGGETRQ